jgi:hypothetical protein
MKKQIIGASIIAIVTLLFSALVILGLSTFLVSLSYRPM